MYIYRVNLNINYLTLLFLTHITKQIERLRIFFDFVFNSNNGFSTIICTSHTGCFSKHFDEYCQLAISIVRSIGYNHWLFMFWKERSDTIYIGCIAKKKFLFLQRNRVWSEVVYTIYGYMDDKKRVLYGRNTIFCTLCAKNGRISALPLF